MELLWGIGLVFVVVATVVAVLIAQRVLRRRKSARTTQEAMDLFLADVGQAGAPPKRRQPEFTEDTAPAVLSVPPELDRPEWERPKQAPTQRWLH
jgi:hypothetical protein